jgi:hypothetical protein
VRLFAELILLAQGGLSQEHYAGAVLRCAHVITAFARLVSEVDTRPNPATCTTTFHTFNSTYHISTAEAECHQEVPRGRIALAHDQAQQDAQALFLV